MKLTLVALSLVCAVAASAVPTVGNVTLTVDAQSPKVKVTYTLTEDAVVTPKFFSGGTEIPGEKVWHLVGDVNRKVRATGAGEVRTLHWATDFENRAEGDPATYSNLSVQLTAWATNAPPDFMVADLLIPSNVTFYASKAYVPQGISNDLYKTTKMLFRKIPAKEVVWNMACSSRTDSGCPDAVLHAVVLSDDYYIGVYQVTQEQNYRVCGSRGYYGRTFDNSPLRPCSGIGYTDILGSNTAMSPSDGSFIGKFRAHTGIASLNLPTEAQWEYACRALTTTMWYNGNKWGSDGAALISWTSSNLSTEEGEQGNTRKYPQPVGTRQPNPWDIYDMAGNVFEYCLDWYDAYDFVDANTAVRDPMQTTQPASNYRVRRGGGFGNDYRYGNTSWRTSVSYTSTDWGNGYRMISAAMAY